LVLLASAPLVSTLAELSLSAFFFFFEQMFLELKKARETIIRVSFFNHLVVRILVNIKFLVAE
jgi:competence protein ComGF